MIWCRLPTNSKLKVGPQGADHDERVEQRSDDPCRAAVGAQRVTRQSRNCSTVELRRQSPHNRHLDSTYDIVVGSDGALWFTEQNGKLGRLTIAGSLVEYQVASQ